MSTRLQRRWSRWHTLVLALAHIVAVQSVLTAATPQPIRLTRDGLYKQRPAWSPDGRKLAYTRHQGDRIWLYVADFQPTAATNDPNLAASDIPTLSAPRRLTQRNEPEYDAVWSPDGIRLAFTFVKVSGTQGDVEVYTAGVDGSGITPFAVTAGALSHEESPAWSPDGRRLAFTSTRDGNQEIYVAPLPGPAAGAEVKRLTNDPALDAHPVFSPDGKRIAFATGRWGDLELAVMDADGSHLTRLTDSRGLDDYPAFSPDGRHLAFTSNRDGNYEVYVMRTDGSEPRNLTEHPGIDHYPSFTPDGRFLSFVSNRSGAFEIYLTPVP